MKTLILAMTIGFAFQAQASKQLNCTLTYQGYRKFDVKLIDGTVSYGKRTYESNPILSQTVYLGEPLYMKNAEFSVGVNFIDHEERGSYLVYQVQNKLGNNSQVGRASAIPSQPVTGEVINTSVNANDDKGFMTYEGADIIGYSLNCFIKESEQQK